MVSKKQKFFIDASPLAGQRASGVGHSVLGFVRALVADPDFNDRYDLYLVAPFRGMKYVREHNFAGAHYVRVPLPARVWNRLPGTALMPPMDLFLGRGVYFLTNFRSWPLAWSKSITLVHDIAFRLYPDSLTIGHRHFLEQQVALWKARSTLIATVSESAKHDIHKHLGIPENRIVVLHNGIDTTKFYPRPSQEIESAREKYGLPEKYILYVGNFEPRKNLHRVIGAYTGLPRELRDQYGLVLVGGSTWLGDKLDQDIAEAVRQGANIVRPDAYVTDDELPAVFSGASMLAWPALHEGFGMPLLEAMACGVPVLTADNSSLPEVAGEAAVFVDALSQEQIEAGMAKLLDDEHLRKSLVEKGHKRVAEFTWDRTASKLVAVADRMTGRKVAEV